MGAEQYHGNSPEKRDKELTPEQLEHYSNAEKSVEKAAEKSRLENAENSEAKLKVEALKQAVSVERGSAEKKGKEPTGSAPHRYGIVGKQAKKEAFKRNMQTIQADMPSVQRNFSKFIHNPVIEKSSEVIGSTVARPNAILAGAVVAFLAVLIVYLTAKHFGYVLSGFETIGAFIVGWVLGATFDFFRVMITGKKS